MTYRAVGVANSTDDPGAGGRIGAMLACAAILAGCAGQGGAPAAPRVNLSGYSVEFKQGYADGCASVTGAMKRDGSRFETDAPYARGWRDGYSICKR